MRPFRVRSSHRDDLADLVWELNSGDYLDEWHDRRDAMRAHAMDRLHAPQLFYVDWLDFNPMWAAEMQWMDRVRFC